MRFVKHGKTPSVEPAICDISAAVTENETILTKVSSLVGPESGIFENVMYKGSPSLNAQEVVILEKVFSLDCTGSC